jgi:hypothetical protein
MCHNVKEHATLSAGASVDHGVDVEVTEEHVNRAADRGCCVSTCSAVLVFRSRSWEGLSSTYSIWVTFFVAKLSTKTLDFSSDMISRL